MTHQDPFIWDHVSVQRLTTLREILHRMNLIYALNHGMRVEHMIVKEMHNIIKKT